MSLAASGPNADQIAYWNERTGPRWVGFQALLDAQISPFGEQAMERAGVAAGERILDVGCGCGQTSLQLGERVGARGTVLGIDLSAPMLERAHERARETGAANVRFEQADAQTTDFDAAPFDLVYSRFGVMFFADPVAAFANLRRALGPEGRLGFVCWEGLDRNPWMRVPIVAAAAHLTLPAPPPPGAPGPFSFADADRLRGILEAAGFREVHFESLEHEMLVGGGRPLDEVLDFVLQMGPLGALLHEAGEAPRAAVRESVREAVAPFASRDGLRMPSTSRVVTARA